jgi:hypothetical protein
MIISLTDTTDRPATGSSVQGSWARQGDGVDLDVVAYLDGISSTSRRRDAGMMIDVMRRATGQDPRVWGSIVGFGEYHYRSPSGREGRSSAAAFAARRSNGPQASSGVSAWPASGGGTSCCRH